MLISNNLEDMIDKKNPRLKRRKYISNIQWDPKWHGQHIQISSDGKVALKLNSSWYSLACAKEGFSYAAPSLSALSLQSLLTFSPLCAHRSGKHFWAIKVEGDEAYIGITQKGNSSLDNYLGGTLPLPHASGFLLVTPHHVHHLHR